MRRAPWWIFCLGVAGCTAESSGVWDARDGYFDAVARLDDGAVRASVTPEYVAAEAGRVLTIDSVIRQLETMRVESLTIQYAFADSVVRVDPPIAWAVFGTRRISERPLSVDTTFALASAVFRRDGAGWRLALLHTTPLASSGAAYSPRPTSATAAPATRRTAPNAPRAKTSVKR